jgi:hypothetical protein
MLENSKVETSIIKYFISDELLDRRIILDTKSLENQNSFDILIEFSSPIISFRNHDYSWVAICQDRIANDFSPKVICLKNGLYVQANCNLGIWEINKKNTKQLLWRFNPKFSASITQYRDENNIKDRISAKSNINSQVKLALLISSKGAIELSRSPIPFSAIACFTDHCDFDTDENLKIQRAFFHEKGIKITKGFFLNNFSKREDNASFQKNSSELDKWREEGHELCYHSLTQSVRENSDSLDEFTNFNPPYKDISVWIDHGFQPYNLSLYNKSGITESDFSNNLKKNNIKILWNYIDSGTATFGVINQLNSSQFSLKSYWIGIKNKSFKQRISLFVKNCIFHYYSDNKLTSNYYELATSYKLFSKVKSIKSLFLIFKKGLTLIVPLLKIFIFWNSKKNKIYEYAKYSPIFFGHIIGNEKFIIFQTLELLDFIETFNKKSIDLLISERGMFIGHTYFSVPMDYHDGKILKSKGKINSKVEDNFKYLGEKITCNEIWNPTLSQLINFYNNYQNTYFDIDEKGTIFIIENQNIPYRSIS